MYFQRLSQTQTPEYLWIGCAVRAADVVQQAWREDRPVMIHGWIYDLKEGLLRDLDMN